MPFICDMSNIDASYDEVISNDIRLRWLPWVGKKYPHTDKRTMILGESTYNWEPGNEEVCNRIDKNDHIRIIHQNHALNYKRKSGFVRNIERAIFNDENPTVVQKQMLWCSVVYHNLVLRHMPAITDRPKYNDYLSGWTVFLDLARLMDLDQCIVYGLERNKIDALIEMLNANQIPYKYNKLKVRIGKSYPKIIYIDLDLKRVKLIFIRHPSSYFSWEKWGLILREEFEIPKITS